MSGPESLSQTGEELSSPGLYSGAAGGKRSGAGQMVSQWETRRQRAERERRERERERERWLDNIPGVLWPGRPRGQDINITKFYLLQNAKLKCCLTDK